MMLVKAVKRAPLSLAPAVTFWAELFYQSGPHWTVSPCSLVRRRPEHVGFLHRRRRDFVNGERKSLEAVELGKRDIVECVFSSRKWVFQSGDGGGAHIRLTLSGSRVDVRVYVYVGGYCAYICGRVLTWMCVCSCLRVSLSRSQAGC